MDNSVDQLLSKLDREQLEDFIRELCMNDNRLQKRFLALCARSQDYKSEPEIYVSRVEDLIDSYTGRYGYIEYRDTFGFSRDVFSIIDEADAAMAKGQWDKAMTVLIGVSSVAEDILNSGDDSAGELGGTVDYCFKKWHELCAMKTLPDDTKSEIFELALSRFTEQDLKGWDWWWDWIEMAIELVDTPERQSRVIETLDAIKPEGNDWSSRDNAETAQKYKLQMMSRCGSPEEQIKFMYDNVSNPDFREKLIQKAWSEANYDEVLRLAKDGVKHDAKYCGLVIDWRKWEYLVYKETGDKANQLQLARYFFFNGGRWGDKELNIDSMYSTLQSLVQQEEWGKYVVGLIAEGRKSRKDGHLTYIFTKEKKWKEYMDYLRNEPSIYEIDSAPADVKELYKDEIIKLYASAVRGYFKMASNRAAYREGVVLLRKLINYGGKKEADRIAAEQRSRTPRRPALIDELSKL